jgi:hypothetical protein
MRGDLLCGCAKLENRKIINILQGCVYVHKLTLLHVCVLRSTQYSERGIFVVSELHIKQFCFFWGGVDECILWLGFAQQTVPMNVWVSSIQNQGGLNT